MFERIKEKQEQKRKALEKAEQDKRIKERALINKSLRNLKTMIDRYESQKQTLIQLAREAERRGLTAQYNMAANGLKILVDSQDKANQMYLNLTISNHIKEMFNDTKAFVDAMSTISTQLSEIQSTFDIDTAQYEYANAMENISKAEEKLQEFSDSICDTANSYVESSKTDSKVDDAISALIHSSDGVALPETENNVEIDRKIKELEGMLNGCR